MELALIPPLAYRQDSAMTRMQLVLPRLYMDYKLYAEMYQAHAGNGCFIILDNGAAENEQVTDYELSTVAQELMPDEVAIPDVLGDAKATINRAQNFIEEYLEKYTMIGVAPGFVAQGCDVLETLDTIWEAYDRWNGIVKTIYIPRRLINDTGNKTARIEVMQNNLPDCFEYHFFGATGLFPDELRVAATLPNLRSMDTSLPYNYAWFNQPIDFTDMNISRPNDYFHLLFNSEQREYSIQNIQTMLRWINE